MKNNTFYTLLRTYAAQARRRGVSYASQVNELVRLRSASIDAGGGSAEAKEALRASVLRAVQNEYAPYDASYNLPT